MLRQMGSFVKRLSCVYYGHYWQHDSDGHKVFCINCGRAHPGRP